MNCKEKIKYNPCKFILILSLMLTSISFIFLLVIFSYGSINALDDIVNKNKCYIQNIAITNNYKCNNNTMFTLHLYQYDKYTRKLLNNTFYINSCDNDEKFYMGNNIECYNFYNLSIDKKEIISLIVISAIICFASLIVIIVSSFGFYYMMFCL